MQTIQELKNHPKEVITPVEAAGLLGWDPYCINLLAKKDPGALGFPVIVMGSRVRIPKAAFIRFIEHRQLPAQR